MSHRILRLEVIRPGGVRSSEHRVFCRYKRRSVTVETCSACVRCDSIVATPVPAVNCTIPAIDDDRGPDPLGEHTAVGQILVEGVVALEPSTTIGDALRLLRSEDRRSFAIVDESRAMIGVIHEAAFVTKTQGRPSHRSNDETLAKLMSGTVKIHEAVPVRRALELLAAAHLREATVVDADGVPLGLFRDVDGLRWIVASRRAT